MLGAVVGAGAVRVHIGASSLLQAMRMAVASIRYIGRKDVIVYFRY